MVTATRSVSSVQAGGKEAIAQRLMVEDAVVGGARDRQISVSLMVIQYIGEYV